MGSLDRQARSQIVTTRGKVLGHNYTDATETDLSQGVYTSGGGGYSDLYKMIGYNPTTGIIGAPYPDATNAIRVLQPHLGQMAEFYLDFQCTGALDINGNLLDKVIEVRFAIGQFVKIIGGPSDPDRSDYTQPLNDSSINQFGFNSAYVKKMHKLITGTETPFSSHALQVTALKLNLANAIEFYQQYGKVGNDITNDPVINILVCFNGAPSGSGPGGNFLLNTFKVTYGVTGVL